MSLHEELVDAIHREMEATGEAIPLSPTAVAIAVQRRYADGIVEPHLQYASLEHIKQMARRLMAARHEPAREGTDVLQEEMFAGYMQDRYPIPREKGAEPVYKSREYMSDEEMFWNADQLRKSGKARIEHADAILAWVENRRRSPAAA